MKLRRCAICAAFLAPVAIVPSATAGVLDQSQAALDPSGGFFTMGSGSVVGGSLLAQTFTNGISGTLDQVDVVVSRPADYTVPLTVEIRSVVGGVPSGPTLASEIVAATSVQISRGTDLRFVSIPLDPPVAVAAGVQYAIVFSTSGLCELSCYVWWLGPVGDPYLAGSGFRSSSGPWTSVAFFGRDDFTFRTYVATPAERIVDIDSKNGAVNCRNPHAMITVTVLTTGSFDAADLDIASVKLDGAREAHGGAHPEDVDADGDIDLVLHFRLGETTLDCASTHATLTGETLTGQPVQGSDTINMHEPGANMHEPGAGLE